MDHPMIYVRMKRKIVIAPKSIITISDIAHLSGAEEDVLDKIKSTKIYQVSNKDGQYAVIDSIKLIRYLQHTFPHLTWEVLGFTETVLHIRHAEGKNKRIKFIIAWFILFVGTAMTIINFHYDVSMAEVHQKLHYFFTGQSVSHPLWLQIPYSFGLGIGMVLFLNHWFKKQFDEEPSPLELELFAYEQQVEAYLAYHENDLNE